jgi:alpha-galactosidase
MWRTGGDISDNYASMIVIGFSQNGLEKYAGPGHWNDPDMLEIGNGGMTFQEQRTQMTLWCLLAAPLFAGNDLAKMNSATLGLLTNPEVIAVDQDPEGIQGRLAWQEGPLEAWIKPLSDGSRAIGLVNTENQPMSIGLHFQMSGQPGAIRVRDLWLRKDLRVSHARLMLVVPAHGAILLKTGPGAAVHFG